MYGSDYLFPVLLAIKSGGGGGQPTFNYGASLSMTIDSSTFVVTAQLLDQNGNALGQAQTIDLPLESVVVGGSYDDTTKKVVLTLQNGNTVEFSVADLVSGLQTELSATNKLNPAYINYDSTHAAVTDTEKATWNAKADVADIPTVPVKGVAKNGTAITPDASGVVNITVPTTATDVSALPNTTLYGASIDLSIDTATFIVTMVLKDQNGNSLGQPQTIDLPLESVVVNGSYNDTTKKIVLTLQNGNTIEFSVADLVDGLESSAHAASTYQTQAGMGAYETSAHAAQTYQPIGSYATTSDIADMATETWVSQQGFETSAHAANTYQTQAGMSNYATRTDIIDMETTTNKVTALSASSTDTEYPSAKCVYDLIGDVETILATLTTP